MTGLDATPCFREPPAEANQQKSRVFEELRRLSFEGVADKLQDPSDNEQGQRDYPPAVEYPGDDKEWQ